MACTNDKFVINKGMVNEFIITIKQNNSTLPMAIELTDTFRTLIYKLEDNSQEAEVTMLDNPEVGVVEVYDASNGQIMIKLYDSLVNTLESERGEKPDRYYLKPTYRLAIDCDTVNNGNFVAKINNVYVEA